MEHLNLEEVKAVIKALPNEFDSHKFILEFISLYETEYVEKLYDKINSENVFQAFHAQIGKFLMDNSAALKIRKLGTTQSENIKGNISENAKWEKL